VADDEERGIIGPRRTNVKEKFGKEKNRAHLFGEPCRAAD